MNELCGPVTPRPLENSVDIPHGPQKLPNPTPVHTYSGRCSKPALYTRVRASITPPPDSTLSTKRANTASGTRMPTTNVMTATAVSAFTCLNPVAYKTEAQHRIKIAMAPRDMGRNVATPQIK